MPRTTSTTINSISVMPLGRAEVCLSSAGARPTRMPDPGLNPDVNNLMLPPDDIGNRLAI
jgi:hypothetical protein